MAVTPGALGRRYLPFIALGAVQVLLVAVAPSKGPQAGTSVASGASVGPGGASAGANGGLYCAASKEEKQQG